MNIITKIRTFNQGGVIPVFHKKQRKMIFVYCAKPSPLVFGYFH